MSSAIVCVLWMLVLSTYCECVLLMKMMIGREAYTLAYFYPRKLFIVQTFDVFCDGIFV